MHEPGAPGQGRRWRSVRDRSGAAERAGLQISTTSGQIEASSPSSILFADRPEEV